MSYNNLLLNNAECSFENLVTEPVSAIALKLLQIYYKFEKAIYNQYFILYNII